jgi:hypothetical protein
MVDIETLHPGRGVTSVPTPVTGDPTAEPLPFETERPSCNAVQKEREENEDMTLDTVLWAMINAYAEDGRSTREREAVRSYMLTLAEHLARYILLAHLDQRERDRTKGK